jgi:hypothetical protein
VALLSQWEEWFAGVLNPDVDPADYDAFSLAPLSELSLEEGLEGVGFFYRSNILRE